jgi:hypothetical protein
MTTPSWIRRLFAWPLTRPTRRAPLGGGTHRPLFPARDKMPVGNSPSSVLQTFSRPGEKRRMRGRKPAEKPSLTLTLSQTLTPHILWGPLPEGDGAEGDRWISPPRDLGFFSESLSRNARAAHVFK